jgi:hypothetical protein
VSTTHAPARTLTPTLPTRPRAASGHGDELRAFGFLLASAGLALGVLALMYRPLLLGSAGITLGLAAKHAGVGFGRVAVAVAMAGTVLGPTFGSVVHALLVGG